MTLRHDQRIRDEIRETIAADPKADDITVVTETADRTGFPLTMVLSVHDRFFAVKDPN